MSAGIANGALAQRGLLDAGAVLAAEDLLARVSKDGLETIRVLFVDQHGQLRGKTLVAAALASVFRAGMAVPSTLLLKDTSHRTVFPVWSPDAGIASGPMQGANDILLVPDAASFRRLPWSPHSAWLLARPVHRSGADIPFAPDAVLRRATGALAALGLEACFGLEVEFHVFERLDAALDHADTTMPPRPPMTRALTQGYQFLTETRYGAAEQMLDELRRMAQGLGLAVRSVEIEMGPSQFEFTFEPGSAAQQADGLVMFRTMVKQVCAARGLHASFMTKPRLDNIAANGWHIHQSVIETATGRNLMMPEVHGSLPATASAWIAGLLDHAGESALLTAPSVNSYKRYAPFQLAPNRVQWGMDNRGAMVRALLAVGDPASRVENRAPDPMATPHYAFAAQILSGLSGLRRAAMAPPPSEDPYGDAAPLLPANLGAAIAAFSASSMYRDTLGDEAVDYLCRLKRAEWERYLSAISEWEQAEYFGLF